MDIEKLHKLIKFSNYLGEDIIIPSKYEQNTNLRTTNISNTKYMKPLLRRDDLVYPELSYQLIGYAYEVFDELGPEQF